MRTIQLHPLSVLVGLGIATLAFVAMAQSPTPIDPVLCPRSLPQPVIAARDMVQIKEGTPFTVPQGKIFVLTGLGRTTESGASGATNVYFGVNGVSEVFAVGSAYSQGGGAPFANGTTMKSVPSGLTAPAGALLDVDGGGAAVGTERRAWGYLADA